MFQEHFFCHCCPYPKSVAKPAIHLLSGTLPAEAQLDVKILTMLRHIAAADKNSPPVMYIKDLIVRQLVIKDFNSNSWVIRVRKLLNKDQLPSAYDLLEMPPKKNPWKKMVMTAIHRRWTKDLQQEAEEMSTLQYMSIPACSTSSMHPIWNEISSPLNTAKATIRAKMLTNRYPVMSSPTSGAMKDARCPLCHDEDETLEHLLLRCRTLSDVRRPYMQHIMNIFRELNISVDPGSVIRVILDPLASDIKDIKHQENCRNLIYKIHSARSVYLGGDSCYKLAAKIKFI